MKVLKRAYDALSEPLMMTISGMFLFASLLDLLLNYFANYDIPFPVDPAWGSIIISGTPLVVLALQRLFKSFFISSALLISIAMVAAILTGEIFAAGEVAFIMAIGAWLEERTTDKARKGIEGLLKLVPEQGRRITTDEQGNVKQEIVPSEQLEVDDVIRILPGENIPADGEIIDGQTSINQSILTGESLPVDKKIGDSVFAATINTHGVIDIRIAKELKNSSLQKMINLVNEAEKNQAPMQKLVDKWAQWLVPIACFIAILTFVFTNDLTKAVTILVVFCPCALALATPTAIVAAIGQATKHGVLIKSGEALEKMGKVTTVAFDKTGTITEGRLSVTEIFNYNCSDEELLRLLGSCESKSEHPIGKAVVKYIEDKNIDWIEAEEFVMEPGKGISGDVNGSRVICGNEAMMNDNAIAISKEKVETLRMLQNQGKAVIIVAKDSQVIGIVALSDQIKTNSANLIENLNRSGIKKTILLTGDNENTANHIANQVGITNVRASLLPENKVNEVKKLQESGNMICMVGDGVNDAPALKLASVGIAMGSMGSDIAIDAADIALMGDDLDMIGYSKRLSNETLSSIKINITLSMVINFVAIVCSILGLLNPITGAIVHNVGSVLVVLNAARLYDKKI
ncbi:heavy metal translocating P-type ATPase [Vallitalea okinawensis]|uniref:heavy metal translocating P-type ATPase n=1 Tax=Vallitalea okinawensis TaxID=2078660 RepID=UPI000CFD6741|nr:cation-translocating P-type ATPase [Vallitalea okinawensis]